MIGSASSLIGNDSSNLHIGKNRQLFFDNQMIERVQDMCRRATQENSPNNAGVVRRRFRPLALGLYSQVRADFLEGDFELPA